ncbi:hypothetical protein [Microlunatus antarcticus]|uniref:RibD C-terminal domain-containing protein n=1 Tax=Microlunatus antarcticus TaxID=53388 RepID=A0A7W5JYF9_9ACTN|nr:hypothetical protein [Microlunatus antarcticus]MBB3327977.1 hypothetical protein [Microlunatus antarcticus]
MKTHYCTATSIDGYIADEENSLAWLFQFSEGEPGEGDDAGVPGRYATFLAGIGAVVMG